MYKLGTLLSNYFFEDITPDRYKSLLKKQQLNILETRDNTESIEDWAALHLSGNEYQQSKGTISSSNQTK